jgi:Zn-dependent metalloprotease
MKYVVPVLALFTIVGVSLYSVDLKQARKDIEETAKEIAAQHNASEKLALATQKLQFDLEQQTAKLQQDIQVATQAAKVAGDILPEIQALSDKATASEQQIEERREKAVTVVATLTSLTGAPSGAADPNQIRALVVAEVVTALKDVLPSEQYARLEMKLAEKHPPDNLQRQIFDAGSKMTLPGTVVRVEGDAPVSSQDVNTVYDIIGSVNEFLVAATGRGLSSFTGGSVVATLHYGESFQNSFWTGQQLVVGDGDGELFKKGGFLNVQTIAADYAHAIVQSTSGLIYGGQAGAINQSYSYIGSCPAQWCRSCG